MFDILWAVGIDKLAVETIIAPTIYVVEMDTQVLGLNGVCVSGHRVIVHERGPKPWLGCQS
jgi:hypothetical protein